MFKINKAPDLIAEHIIDESKQFSTSLLCDSMSGLGAMDYRIKPITSGTKLAGTAFTVNLKAGTALAVIAAVALAGKGHVLVISGKEDPSNVVFGALMAQTALKSGVEGIVADGMVRDIAQLREYCLPLFALGAVPSAAQKDGPGQINCPVSCGGIAVNPGDLIVGDDDGVVVVPRDRIESVLAAAKNKAAVELKRSQEIENGLLLPEWLRQRIEELEK